MDVGDGLGVVALVADVAFSVGWSALSGGSDGSDGSVSGGAGRLAAGSEELLGCYPS